MSDVGAEVCFHKFQSRPNEFQPLHFLSSLDSGLRQRNFSCFSYSISTVGRIRVPRADGKEAIVTADIPTGPHGAYRDFQVDAIRDFPKFSYSKARKNEFLLQSDRKKSIAGSERFGEVEDIDTGAICQKTSHSHSKSHADSCSCIVSDSS
ncbi:hypothetical protein K2173_014398 [Erythroxylum novogranatense]|uniref:Uncharacterized protein n=1 Tax=Erythroxylum novogranatense TaxID=1862640 RepID=A0AAV8S4Y6_9ROSI|nr:hypothetical protein K2173_014398 [Erythroxylum novogranatense]